MFQARSQFSRFGFRAKPGDLPHHVLIFKLYNAKETTYRAFCAGSIISTTKVLSSAHCFLTNRKRPRQDNSKLMAVAGIVETIVFYPPTEPHQQWRAIQSITSQRFLRFPAYSLAVLTMAAPWTYDKYVKNIPFESSDHDFDGVCDTIAVKATKSWSFLKNVYKDEVKLIPRRECENMLQRDLRNHFCADSMGVDKSVLSETEGGGLICHETGDPEEIDSKQGILVGVTAAMNVGLPNLYMRIGKHSKWVRRYLPKSRSRSKWKDQVEK